MKRKRKTIKSVRNKNLPIFRSRKTVILTFLFICGLIIGSVCVKKADENTLEKIKELTESFILQRSSQSILRNFAASLCTDAVFIGLSAVFGLCLVGEPVLWLLPLVRGLGIGVTSGYIYKTYNLSGVMYCLAIIYIPAMLSVAATVISCKESILTSREILKSVKENKPLNKPDYFKLYIIRNGMLFGLTVFAAGTGAVLTYFFSESLSLLS